MEALFGIPMNTIMLVLVALFGLAVASVAFIYITSGHMFRMGVRNIPRRGLQSGLVIVGLMLATLITTAAFTTGDTVDHSISRAGYEQLQRTDLQLNLMGDNDLTISDISIYMNEGATAGLERAFAGDPDIEGFIPLLQEPVGVSNSRSGQSEPFITLSGIDTERMVNLGGLRLANGGAADLDALGTNDILLSERAAEKLDARTGDTLTLYANGSSAQVTIVAIVKDELVTSGSHEFYQKGSGGGAMLLSSVQRLTGYEGQINQLNVALKGSVATSYKSSESAISRLEPFLNSSEGMALLGAINPVSVSPTKADAVAEAEETGNLFTTFFLVIGLFSIAAGIMLIFMIFVMLATERKAEMGMARAVGAQRSSLVQAFMSEGMAYSLIAGAVGALVGVAAAVGLVAGFLKISGGFDFIEAHITVRSLVISYCLGVVITFLTVVFSSLKVSSVNIVSAIRGTEEDDRRPARQKIAWGWVGAGIPAMIVPPLGIWFLLRKGFGLSWTWIIAPIGLVLAILFIYAGGSSGSQPVFSLGVSILPLCLAMLASYYRAPGRLTGTLVGAYLAAYWLAPVDYGELLLGKELTGDIEMFVLSGVMVVISFTLIIVYNARLLTAFFQQDIGPRYAVTLGLVAFASTLFVAAVMLGESAGGLGELLYLFGGIVLIGAATSFAAVRFPQIAPALKMGVAYPLSNRFRTGMTIAMFSLIIFSLATFSAINSSFVAMLTAEGGDGGWDVIATASRNSGVTDTEAALKAAGASVADDIASVGRVTTFNSSSRVRVPGEEYQAFPVLAADDGFFSMTDARLHSWVKGYDNERAVFDAVSGGSNLALVDPSVLPDGFNNFEFNVDLTVKDKRFEPFDLEYTDSITGQQARVTVVGVLAIQVNSTYTAGVYVSEGAYRSVFGEPQYLRTYVKLNSDSSARRAAQEIEAALVAQGIQAESTRVLLDEAVAENNSFIRMFQGFMALGLFTGIAALGVIAYRSVVERRQQIGMLRAIGYQRGTVALTFVLESGFIALMGILSGVVGGMIIARNLLTSGQFGDEGIQFAIPWAEVMIIVSAAFVVSMFMTWWPSRQAARVAVADALRYE